MVENKIKIPIRHSTQLIDISIVGSHLSPPTIINDALENGESPYQISEGCFYEYQISDGYYLEPSEIVTPSKFNGSIGRISPNIYVGTLAVNICNSKTKEKVGELQLEVRSSKAKYREDYRQMLEDITEKCVDLLLQHNSPVSHFFESDFKTDSKTLYQRFAFIKSIIETPEFNESVQKIVSHPVTKWKEGEIIKDFRSVNRVNSTICRQIASSSRRIALPGDHPLQQTLYSVPSKLNLKYKTETVDTTENRFIKHTLITFQSFCSDIKNKGSHNSKVLLEIALIEEKLEQYINHSVFKEVSRLTSIPLNSPILQRKEGYREILRVWLMFDLAAKLIWHGGEDVYSGNKRDVAVLYEYWLFFKLLDIIEEVFKINSDDTIKLIEPTKDGLGLKLKQGKFLPIKGVYKSDSRNFNVEFSYNRTFTSGNSYPNAGSWTRTLRPDYTISMWPVEITQEQAEMEELIVHIHFDAKYKIENLQTIFSNEDTLEEEKEAQNKGNYKRADLLKMHTYRDAIRRTAGAYILYPGSKQETRRGFHELLPGLGAFPIRPSKNNDGTSELKRFLKEVADHFTNRASQREKISLHAYETYKTSVINQVKESLPEPYGVNRNLLPDETHVLVGFYKNSQHLKWIEKNMMYNTRMGKGNGSLRLNPENTGAKYLLLHGHDELITNKLYKLKSKGPRILSRKDLGDSYPNPNHDFYLVFDIEGSAEQEFTKFSWSIKDLKGFTSNRTSALPFSVSLSELMRVSQAIFKFPPVVA